MPSTLSRRVIRSNEEGEWGELSLFVSCNGTLFGVMVLFVTSLAARWLLFFSQYHLARFICLLLFYVLFLSRDHRSGFTTALFFPVINHVKLTSSSLFYVILRVPYFSTSFFLSCDQLDDGSAFPWHLASQVSLSYFTAPFFLSSLSPSWYWWF